MTMRNPVMTNDEPNKTFEISCSVTIPVCYGIEDALEDFRMMIWREQLELEVKDVTEEVEHKLTTKGWKMSNSVKELIEEYKNETET